MSDTVQAIWTQIRALSPEERQLLISWLLAEQRASTVQEQAAAAQDGNAPPPPHQGEGEFEERERIL